MITLIILLCILAVAVIVAVIGFCIGIERHDVRTALGMDAGALGRLSEKSRYGRVPEHADGVYRAIKLGCYVAGRHGRFSYDYVLPEHLCRAYTKDELEQRIAPPVTDRLEKDGFEVDFHKLHVLGRFPRPSFHVSWEAERKD